MKHIADLSPLPTPSENSAPPAGLTAESLAAELDDELVAYVLEAQLGFDLLRRAATLLAGLMVLAAAGVRGARAHPMLAQAQEAATEAGESLAGIHVPRRAAHHHLHLTRAGEALAEALKQALVSLRWSEDRLDSILPPLRACERELHWTTAALPGFQKVSLDQACCATQAPA
jgi:hypothetical protein